MLKEAASTGNSELISSRAVALFRIILPNGLNFAKVRHKNIQKASSWWKNRKSILTKLNLAIDSQLYVSSTKNIGTCRWRFPLNNKAGRGRRIMCWVQFIYDFADS